MQSDNIQTGNTGTKKIRIEDALEKNGLFVSTTVGCSMYPMLRNRRDTIIVMPYQGRLKKYDVPLYRRGKDYVLHRIVEVRPDDYVICGDNCIQKEYGITDAQILGVLKGFYRENRQINMDGPAYKIYVRIWCSLYPFRRLYYSVRGKMSGIWHRIKRGGAVGR